MANATLIRALAPCIVVASVATAANALIQE